MAIQSLFRFGPEKEVFVDAYALEAGYGSNWGKDGQYHMPHGVEFVTERPRLAEGHLIFQDKPWESHNVSPYTTVLEDGGRYRMWYMCMDTPKDESSMVAYAESDDGVNWIKPELGICDYGNHAKTNLVYTHKECGFGPHGATVFIDPSAAPDKRYKMIHSGPNDGGPQRVHGATSPDGLNWTPIETPLCEGYADTQTVARWDEKKQKYVGYFRHWTTWGEAHTPGRRLVAYSETEDFERWPFPEVTLWPEPDDPIDWDFYTNSYTAWPGARDAHLLFPAIYERSRDAVSVHLAISRDGRRWSRPLREPLLTPTLGDDALGSLYTGQGIWSVRPGEWSMLYHETLPHNDPKSYYDELGQVSLRRAVIREDGFRALQARERGECWTIPANLDGSELKLNVQVGFGGHLRVELTDVTTGEAVPGYSLEDSVPIKTDTRYETVAWKNGTDFSELKGRALRLRFDLCRAKLYGFKIE